jgi:two-component system LytT family response regulator
LKYQYVIIEDNVKAIESLRLFLKHYPDYQEKGIAHTSKKGILQILEHKPDLIFLDVELEAGTGFEMLRELRIHLTQMPSVIMITSHDHYAKEAVNNNALYFISKPFDPDELEMALHKFEKTFLQKVKHLKFKNAEGHVILNLEEIILIMSDSNYAYLFKTDGEIIPVSKTIKDIETRLPDSFIRIHKSYIVNSTFIEMINTNVKNVIITSTTSLKNLKSKVNEKENLDLHKNDLANKTVNTAHKNEYKAVLPIGNSYLEKLKNTFL